MSIYSDAYSGGTCTVHIDVHLVTTEINTVFMMCSPPYIRAHFCTQIRIHALCILHHSKLLSVKMESAPFVISINAVYSLCY